VDSGHDTEVWAIGFEYPDTNAVPDIRCLPIGDDRQPPDLPLRHYATDPAGTSHLVLRELASVLYLSPGLARWQRSPRLGLAERADRALAAFPAALVVAAQLDDRRCWAQLRGTDPVLLTLQDPITDDPDANSALRHGDTAVSIPLVVASLLWRYRISGGIGRPCLGHRLPMDEPIPARVNGRLHEVRVTVPDPAIAERVDTLAPRPAHQAHDGQVTRPQWSTRRDRRPRAGGQPPGKTSALALSVSITW
jgi:hypothetical protein